MEKHSQAYINLRFVKKFIDLGQLVGGGVFYLFQYNHFAGFYFTNSLTLQVAG